MATETAPVPADALLRAVVGRSVTRVDGVEKATGAGVYAGDIRMAGMLHGKILRSPHAHARIRSIDTSAAERLPGVRAVVTGKDVPALFGPAIEDQPVFALEKVRHHGEAVAAVAAVSEQVAEEALELIRVEYEPLPAVLTLDAALKEGAPLVHEDHSHYVREAAAQQSMPGTNIGYHFHLRSGDVDKALAEADRVFEDTYESQLVAHAAIETHAAVAVVEPNGKITCWSPNDAPFRARKALASIFGVPMTKVRLIIPYQGGGFGGKGGLHAEVFAIALALKTRNRPVRVEYTREESFLSLTRHPCRVTIKSGVMNDGRIIARKVTAYWDTGAFAEKGPTVSRQATWPGSGPYVIPHVGIDAYMVYTNHVTAGAMRGYGVPQITWAHERQMDEIAHALGIDPLELRMRHAFEEGSPSCWGEKMTSVGLKECLRKAATAIDWGTPRPQGRGVGIACAFKPTNSPSSSNAFVRYNEDGSATVLASTVELGQGMRTVMAQIAAEEMGVPVDRVEVVQPDTDVTPFDMATTSSRSTFHMGNAIALAAGDARQQLVAMAADALEAHPEDLVVRDGRISVKGAPDRSITIGQAITSRFGSRGGNVLGRGTYMPEGIKVPDPATGQSERPSIFWMYVAQAAEVELDRETGMVNVLRMSSAHDVGRAINPQGCEGQVEGAAAMGLGGAFLEELLVGAKGELRNPAFLDYRVPTSLDVPPVTPIIVEEPHPEGPYGAKGLGELALAATSACLSNAIFAGTGLRMNQLPINTERVLAAMREQRGGDGRRAS